MSAKYYTYRNLNYDSHFSTKYRGVVINYLEFSVIEHGKFKVSDAGRERCLREKKRNVHAFIVSSDEPKVVCKSDIPAIDTLAEVKYNPYRASGFVNTATGETIQSARNIYLIDGRCYVDHK